MYETSGISHVIPVLIAAVIFSFSFGCLVSNGISSRESEDTVLTEPEAEPETEAETEPENEPEPDEALAEDSLPIPSRLNEVEVKDVVAFIGDEIGAESFVSYDDISSLLVRYISAPDMTTAGKQDVAIIFGDGKNLSETTASLNLIELNKSYCVEIDSNEYVNVRKYVPDKSVNAAFEGITPNDLRRDRFAEYTLSVNVEGVLTDVTFAVTDMTPPTATAKTRCFYVGTEDVPASSLITNIKDRTRVTVSYYKEPDFSKAGTTYAWVLLTDAYDNKSKIKVKLYVVEDNTPPVFSGISDKTIMIGDSTAYRAGVEANDNRDGAVDFTVDSSRVNVYTAGIYTVFYTAVDSSGNTATVKAYITVCDIDSEIIDRYLNSIISSIITPDMTLDERIYAVWKYTKNNVSYTGYSDKSDIYHGSYSGLRYKTGDCYTYYAINTLLFNKLNIKSMSVRRYQGLTNHWWNLVRFSDGKWYFVDSCPLPAKAYEYSDSTNKMTKTDLKVISDFIDSGSESDHYRCYYRYSESMYKNYNVAE